MGGLDQKVYVREWMDWTKRCTCANGWIEPKGVRARMGGLDQKYACANGWMDQKVYVREWVDWDRSLTQVVQLHTHLPFVQTRTRHHRAVLRRREGAQTPGIRHRVRLVQDFQIGKVVDVNLVFRRAESSTPFTTPRLLSYVAVAVAVAAAVSVAPTLRYHSLYHVPHHQCLTVKSPRRVYHTGKPATAISFERIRE